MTNDRMLLSDTRAATLYQSTAKGHYTARCTRDFVSALAKNKPYQNPTELLLAGNAFAQRLLRGAGVEECFASGEGSDFEKFRFFCTVLQNSTGNNLKLQCHAALQMLFDCSLTLCDTHCEKIWRITSEKMREENVTPRNYLKKCGVDRLLAVASPWDDLTDFESVCDLGVLPVFCPDIYFLPQQRGFAEAVKALDGDITDWQSFCNALATAMSRFAAHGCRVAAHSVLPRIFVRPDEYHAAKIFQKALRGEPLEESELALYQAQLWRVFGKEYVKRGIALELPLGAAPLQNDTISDTVMGEISFKALRELADYLYACAGLPRMALYAAQADAFPSLAALAARYPALSEGVPQIRLGILQGSPAENRARLCALANAAPLCETVGTFPDHRLSLTLLDAALFHRTLCTQLSDWEKNGELDVDEQTLFSLVARLTGKNAKEFYGI